ncbi:MAG: 30S ribosomal protein S8 [bacterium]
MSIDSIGNFLTSMRNGLMVGKRSVTVPSSNIKVNIATLLKEEGYIRDFKIETTGPKSELTIFFKYVQGESPIHEIKRVSKPSCRYYERLNNLTPVIGGLGISILSTSLGLMTDRQAKKSGVGGEVICHIW